MCSAGSRIFPTTGYKETAKSDGGDQFFLNHFVSRGFGNSAISFAYGSSSSTVNQALIAFGHPAGQYSFHMQEPLDIRHLRYFLAVAEAKSFSRAADRLGISQPSVFQQMRDLEAGLRVLLFQRRGERIVLTPRRQIFQAVVGLPLL